MQYKSWLNLQKELNLKINAVVNLHFPQMQMSYWWKPAASPLPPPLTPPPFPSNTNQRKDSVIYGRG